MAVVYAIMMTRDEDLTWQMRAIRVLPMFVLPAVSSLIYSTVVSFTRMRKCPKWQFPSLWIGIVRFSLSFVSKSVLSLFLTHVIPVFSLLLVCKISRGLIFPFVLPFVKFVCSAWTLVSGRFTSVLEICVWYFQNSYNMKPCICFPWMLLYFLITLHVSTFWNLWLLKLEILSMQIMRVDWYLCP